MDNDLIASVNYSSLSKIKDIFCKMVITRRYEKNKNLLYKFSLDSTPLIHLIFQVEHLEYEPLSDSEKNIDLRSEGFEEFVKNNAIGELILARLAPYFKTEYYTDYINQKKNENIYSHLIGHKLSGDARTVDILKEAIRISKSSSGKLDKMKVDKLCLDVLRTQKISDHEIQSIFLDLLYEFRNDIVDIFTDQEKNKLKMDRKIEMPNPKPYFETLTFFSSGLISKLVDLFTAGYPYCDPNNKGSNNAIDIQDADKVAEFEDILDEIENDVRNMLFKCTTNLYLINEHIHIYFFHRDNVLPQLFIYLIYYYKKYH